MRKYRFVIAVLVACALAGCTRRPEPDLARPPEESPMPPFREDGFRFDPGAKEGAKP